MSLPGCRFPAATGPGPRRARNLPGVRPRLGAQPAARSPRRSGRAWEDARTDRRSAGLRARPCALIGRMCLLGSLQLLPSPTGESRESVPAPGSWGLGSEGRESPGRWQPVGPARGGQRRPRGAAGPEAHRAGQRLRPGAVAAPGTPRRWARGACPAGRRVWDLAREGRGREGDLEEGSASDVRSALGPFPQLPAASALGSCA